MSGLGSFTPYGPTCGKCLLLLFLFQGSGFFLCIGFFFLVFFSVVFESYYIAMCMLYLHIYVDEPLLSPCQPWSSPGNFPQTVCERILPPKEEGLPTYMLSSLWL